MPASRSYDRAPADIRPVTIEPEFVATADGSALIFVGLLGFAAWLVWLLVTGVRLIRS